MNDSQEPVVVVPTTDESASNIFEALKKAVLDRNNASHGITFSNYEEPGTDPALDQKPVRVITAPKRFGAWTPKKARNIKGKSR